MKTSLWITVIVILSAAGLQAEPIQDHPWKFVLRKPADNWRQADFNDSDWNTGFGGFGTRDTPGSRIGTEWEGRNIWLRQVRTLEAPLKNPALYLYHDEDVEVFINGAPVFSKKGYITSYQMFPLDDRAKKAIKKGRNVIAVHCRQTSGGQAIDVHLVEADSKPELPEPKRAERPFLSELITPWGEKVTAENAWTEYPRPNLVRRGTDGKPAWKNLNGNWDYAITGGDSAKPGKWQGNILVPFAVESRLSGVQRLLHPDQALWYHREFDWKPTSGKRSILHFEAVDYACSVQVNGKPAGSHIGGNLPFHFDVTDLVRPGKNHLQVRVEDTTGGTQLRGKQRIDPRGIWYTRVSGIWQTVWMEETPALAIESIKVCTKIDGTVDISVKGNTTIPAETQAAVTARLKGREVAATSGSAGALQLHIPQPSLWSPDSPTLYDLEVKLGDDVVHAQFGIREVGTVRDEAGHLRFTLNGKPFFHWGPLDQGWWPDGLLTPPSDEAMRFDVDWLKAAGFNMIRKHIKVEPRRFYHYCDTVGMLVWQDQVSAIKNPPWTRLKADPVDAEWTDKEHAQYMTELQGMMDHLDGHASIVVWVPFNEAWGQHRTVEVGKWTMKYDTSRHINIASGGNFWPVGHVVDQHAYPHPDFPFDAQRYDRDFVKVVGEFGGHGLPSEGHLWDASRRNWGYGGLPQNKAEYLERYETSIRKLNELRAKGIAGGVYTQTTDVEGEINGLMSYDRKVIKIPAERLKELHQILFQ